MHGKISIHPANGIADVPALLDLWRGSKEKSRDLMSASDVDWLAHVLEAIYRGDAEVIIAQQEESTVGFMVLTGHKVPLLWLSSDTRGGGAGQKLLRWALARHPNLLVDVNIHNHRGIEFYRQQGFEPAELTSEEDSPDQQRMWLSHRKDKI
ncbi:GNAT family N-acetyltransferase [Glutamicibacter uratoxydans]|uniref:GNAT family N-acetyltransferase n=1 Tax=Glutamicibacter uratoxydans TaxID=43667 RepID=UPI003D6F54FB